MISLVDNSLRDGEQSPGVVFNRQDKISLAFLLAEAGIRHIEAGSPAICAEEKETLKELARLNLPATLYSWNRAVKKEVDLSLDCGINHIILSVPVSDQMIQNKLQKERQWVADSFCGVVDYAHKNGAEVVCGLEDSSRADRRFLGDFCRRLEGLGVSRIRLSDTLGILTPDKAADLIGGVRKAVGSPLEFHGHNNFGLALANSLSAQQAGAEFIDVSVLGIGDGSGLAALEEFVGAAEQLLGIETGIDMNSLKLLADSFLEVLGVEAWPWKPVLGKNNYIHESGIHVDGILKDAGNYEMISPDVFGIIRKIVLGKHSGKKSLQYCAQNLGLNLSGIDLEEFLGQVKKVAIDKKSILSAEEVKRIYQDLEPGQRQKGQVRDKSKSKVE